jgi:hypothetical protein
MRLTDLKPKWIQPGNWAELAPPLYIGLSFLCPHCPHTACPTCGSSDTRSKRLFINFWPPIDPENARGRMFEWPEPTHRIHTRTGDTFETLTIEPSIGFENIGHWHGRITNGDIV